MDAITPTESVFIQEPEKDVAKELLSLGFSPATKPSLNDVISATRLSHYAAGETLYHEGSPVDYLYIIRDGRIKMLNFLENGRSRIVRLHQRGSIIGLNGMVDEPYAHTAMSIDEVSCYQIPMSRIKSIKEHDTETYCILLEYWHDYLNMADTWITDFSTGAIRGRVARLIRFLMESDEYTGPRQVTLLTVEEMADILGVTPESVSRVMADFKRKNIIKHIAGEMPERYQCDTKAISGEAEH